MDATQLANVNARKHQEPCRSSAEIGNRQQHAHNVSVHSAQKCRLAPAPGESAENRADTFGIEPPETATLKIPRACTDSFAIIPIRPMSSVARASGLDPTSKVVVMAIDD